MPLDRVAWKPFDALVDHLDGRRGRLCVRGPPLRGPPELLHTQIPKAAAVRQESLQEGRCAMKCLRWAVFLFLLVGVASAVWAGPAEEAAQMLQQWSQAFHEGNAEALAALYAEDAVYISFLFPFRVEGREAIRATFAGFIRAFPTRALAYRQVSTRVYGGTTVTDMYWSLMWGDAKGNVRTAHGRSSATSVEVQGRRVIVDHHTSLLPPSP